MKEARMDLNYYKEESSSAGKYTERILPPYSKKIIEPSVSNDEVVSLLRSINYGLMELNSRVRCIENMLGLECDLRYNKDTADKLDRIITSCNYGDIE